MRSSILITLATLFILSGILYAQDDPVPPFKPIAEIKATPVKISDYSISTLDNGLKIILVPRKDWPSITYFGYIKTGSFYDAKEHAGLSDLTASLLESGMKYQGADLSANQISQLVDSIGAQLGGSSGWNSISVYSIGMSRHRQFLLDMLAGIILHPTFPQSEVDRVKKLKLDAIRSKKDDPATIADERFMKLLYGEHPLAIPGSGDSTSVAGCTREMIVSRWQQAAIPNNSIVAVIGDFESATMLKAVKNAFSGWRGGIVAPEIPQPQPESNGITVQIINRPQAVQSSIAMGHCGVARTYSGYYPLKVLTYILLNGGFDCRLMKTIRSERGLTYDITGYFAAEKIAGPFEIQTDTRTEKTGEMVKGIFEVLDKFVKEGPTDDELFEAKSYLTGRYPSQFESSISVAGILLDLDLLGLPVSTIEEYRGKIAAVTKADVIREAKNLIRTGNMRIVIVGKADDIKPQLDTIGKKFLKVEYTDL